MNTNSPTVPSQFVDLSQVVAPGIPRFGPHAPEPIIRPWMSHYTAGQSGKYDGCTCEITEINMVTSMGTYLDSPYHFNPSGASIDQLSLEQLVLPGVVVDCTPCEPNQSIGPEVLQGLSFRDKAVLFRTDWSRFWEIPETYRRFPYLTEDTAKALTEGGAGLAGIDVLVIDDTSNPRRPVHVTLLQSNVLIVENLANLSSLPREGFTFYAVPVKIAGAAAFPVRAFAVLDTQG